MKTVDDYIDDAAADFEARAAPYMPRPVADPKRFYVTLTWDNWPEGGSYGTVIEADNEDDAEHGARWEMANHREEFDHPADCIDAYGNEWYLVDCWNLDDFLANHTPEPDTNKGTNQ